MTPDDPDVGVPPPAQGGRVIPVRPPRRPLLAAYLVRWPLSPPPFWRQRWVWVVWGLLVWGGEIFTPPALSTVDLGVVSVLLAAWSGDLGWSLGLAWGLPWCLVVEWGWWEPPWPLWMVLIDVGGNLLAMTVAALLMTAVQRQALRLAIERDPQLGPGKEG